jgi:hypothetical protein
VVTDAHFWEQSSETFVGTLKVQVHSEADEQKIRLQILTVLAEDFPKVRWPVIQIEKDAVVSF